MGNRKITRYRIGSDIMDKVNKAIDACEKKYKILVKFNVQIEDIKYEKDETKKSLKK